ncbi:hypothetical protein [Streptomyces sioyaensis]|uniref:hypothetical protein n=1 Tax=Streptomyces sioyaensis TaxID=67364 RepID=UPI003D71BC57
MILLLTHNAQPILAGRNQRRLRKHAEDHTPQPVIRWTDTGKLMVISEEDRHQWTGWELREVSVI